MIRYASILTVPLLAVAVNFAQPRTALAWGDEGHKVVALVAQSLMPMFANVLQPCLAPIRRI